MAMEFIICCVAMIYIFNRFSKDRNCHVTIVLFISRAVAYHYFEQVTKSAVFAVL